MQAATFTWQPSPDADVLFYRIYIGTNTGVYLTNYTVFGTNWISKAGQLFAGVTNYAVVTALNTSGFESDPSNEIAFKPPHPPTGLKLSLQSAPTPGGPWQEQTNWVADIPTLDALTLSRSTTFYRATLALQ